MAYVLPMRSVRLLILSILIASSIHLGCKPRNSAGREDSMAPPSFSIFHLVDSVWKMPAAGTMTAVELGWALHNRSANAIQFPLMDCFQVTLFDSNGREWEMEGGQDVLIPGSPLSDWVPPNERLIFQWKANLAFEKPNQCFLVLEDGFGSRWNIGPVYAGSWRLKSLYSCMPMADGQTGGKPTADYSLEALIRIEN